MPSSWIQDEPEQEMQLKPDISNVRAVETSVIRALPYRYGLSEKREPSRAVIINSNPMKICRF